MCGIAGMEMEDGQMSDVQCVDRYAYKADPATAIYTVHVYAFACTRRCRMSDVGCRQYIYISVGLRVIKRAREIQHANAGYLHMVHRYICMWCINLFMDALRHMQNARVQAQLHFTATPPRRCPAASTALAAPH
jgi:hypothetical protein